MEINLSRPMVHCHLMLRNSLSLLVLCAAYLRSHSFQKFEDFLSAAVIGSFFYMRVAMDMMSDCIGYCRVKGYHWGTHLNYNLINIF